MSLLDLVQQQLGPQEIQQISQQVGADPATTENAVHAAVPMLLGGMANGAREPEGASALGGLLGGGGGGALGGLLGGAGAGGLGGLLGGMLGGGGGGGGGMDMGGMLGSVLGRSQPAVHDGVQQASGLNSDQTKKLLMILAPIVLMALAKRRQQGAAGAGGAMGAGMGSGMGSGMGAGMGGIPGMSGATGGMGGMGGIGGMAGGGVPANQVDSDGDGIPDYLEREAQQAQQQAAQRSPQIGGIVGKILGAAMRPPRS